MTDLNVNVPDQPGYRGDPIAHRLPTQHDANEHGVVFSEQAWRRLHPRVYYTESGFPRVHYTEVLSGEQWSPLPPLDPRPKSISVLALHRVNVLGITPKQVDTIRQKLEEIANTVSPGFLVQEIINNDLCGLVSINWEAALKALREGKL